MGRNSLSHVYSTSSSKFLLKYLTLIFVVLLFKTHVFIIATHPLSSHKLCHGLQQGIEYTYKYDTLMLLNNNDHQGKEPVGFGFTGHFSLENVWEDQSNFLLKILFKNVDGGHFTTRKGDKRRGLSLTKVTTPSVNEAAHPADDSSDNLPLYAHIQDHEDYQKIKAFYVHNRETSTRINVKKTIILLTRTKADTTQKTVKFLRKNQEIHRHSSWSNDAATDGGSILIPEILNEWSSESEVGRDHAVITSSSGWQNVTLRSRIYNEAHSRLHLTYHLRLSEEESTSETSALHSAGSLNAAIKLLGEDYIEEEGAGLDREKQVCHECRTLEALVRDYEDFMTEDTAATVPATIAYLKILERIRSAGPGTSKEDVIRLLRYYNEKKNRELVASLLDVLAGARTEQSILSALDFLNLPSNIDLDICERFLTSLAASCVTSAAQSFSSPITSASSHRFIVEEILRMVQRDNQKWKSPKIKYSTILTLASLLKSHIDLSHHRWINSESKKREDAEKTNEDLTKSVIQVIEKELKSCKTDDADCKIAYLHALANAGNLFAAIDTLEHYALDVKAKRESIAAMKAIKECLEVLGKPLDDSKMIYRLRILVLRVVYDSNYETTARILAAEIITRYLDDAVLSEQLMQAVPGFGNNEMITLMWKRALKLAAAKETPINGNWLVHSTLFNGTSSAFTRNIGGTKTMNATYGVAMELLSNGKILKESSFDFLLGDENNQQHILSVGLFARGLSSYAGGDGPPSGDEDESTMAGMALKIMGFQLRPYTFFSSGTELMGHVWSGTASEPTTAFRGNLLLADHEDGTPLINGFVLEQRLRGVLSLDLSGEAQISWWNRNSHAVVRSKAAALMQGSQSILTSDQTTSASQMFAFGGSTAIETTTDLDFYAPPYKFCVKMTQPEFILRHNTRKNEQVDSEDLHKRIHRRNYMFPAKSYKLHPKIQDVCEAFVTE